MEMKKHRDSFNSCPTCGSFDWGERRGYRKIGGCQLETAERAKILFCRRCGWDEEHNA
jgi:hypothetical protein